MVIPGNYYFDLNSASVFSILSRLDFAVHSKAVDCDFFCAGE